MQVNNKMYAKPINLNLVVILSSDIDKAEQFYKELGLFFEREQHGNGPEHLAACGEAGGVVFEIYPLGPKHQPTTSTRLGFSIDDVDAYIERLTELGGSVVSTPKDSEWGRRAVIKDPDGHTVELITQLNRGAN
ncbi:MAG: VOC family protein [Phycisphaeraceae bacterium]